MPIISSFQNVSTSERLLALDAKASLLPAVGSLQPLLPISTNEVRSTFFVIFFGTVMGWLCSVRLFPTHPPSQPTQPTHPPHLTYTERYADNHI